MPGLFWSNHRLASCCFCMSLKTGCRIIGSLTTFVCSLELISAFHKLKDILERERRCADMVRWEEENKNFAYTCTHINIVQFMLIVDFIIFVIGFNGSVLLLYGIKSKQPKLFVAWLIFSGMVIFYNFFAILIWHNRAIIANTLIVILLSYFFRVVRSYQLQLFEELNGGCPVVAVAFPPDSSMRVFLPSTTTQHRPTSSSDSDYIKDDPPPPYPGLPSVASCASIESQPPPYSVVNLNYDGPPIPDHLPSSIPDHLPSSSAASYALSPHCPRLVSTSQSGNSGQQRGADGTEAHVSLAMPPSISSERVERQPHQQSSPLTPPLCSALSSPLSSPLTSPLSSPLSPPLSSQWKGEARMNEPPRLSSISEREGSHVVMQVEEEQEEQEQPRGTTTDHCTPLPRHKHEKDESTAAHKYPDDVNQSQSLSHAEMRRKSSVEEMKGSQTVKNESHMGKNESQMGKDESQMGKNESHMGKNESQMGKNESHMGKNESHMGKNESHMGKNESRMGKNESHMGKNESHMGKNESHMGKDDSHLAKADSPQDTGTQS